MRLMLILILAKSHTHTHTSNPFTLNCVYTKWIFCGKFSSACEKKIWNFFIFFKSQICCLPQSLIPGSWTLLCRFTVGVIGLELQERKDRGVKASKRQSWLSKRWNAFIRACLVASNVPTSSLPFLSALQCPSAEKISFSRLSRFAALAAISLRSPTSVCLPVSLSFCHLRLLLQLSCFQPRPVPPRRQQFLLSRDGRFEDHPQKRNKKGFFFFFSLLAGDFPHILLPPISICGEIRQKLRQDLAASEVTCKREVFVDLVVKFARLHYMISFESFLHGFNFAWRLESFASAIWARVGKFRFIDFNVFFRKFTGSFLRPS